MPTFTMTKNYSDGNVLTEAMLDAMKSSTETFLNTTKIDGDNIQTGGVPTAAIADSAVTAAKIATAAIGDGLTGGAGTAIAIASSAAGDGLALASGVLSVNVDDSTIETNADTLRVKDSGITTAKINDNAVTQAKRAALGQQVSSSSGAFSTGATSPTDVTNLSVSITTTGRPVFIAMISGSTSTSAFLNPTNGTGNIYFLRDSTTIGKYACSDDATDAIAMASTPFFIDVPSSGTYTYKIQAAMSGAGGTIGVENFKLIAFEL